MLTLPGLILLCTLVLVLAAALGKLPLWVPVLLLVLLALAERLPR